MSQGKPQLTVTAQPCQDTGYATSRAPLRAERERALALANTPMPDLALRHFGGDLFTLSDINSDWIAYYLYPGTNDTNFGDQAEGPAADVAEHRAFRENKEILAAHGVRVVGVSAQTRREQLETINANRIAHLMLSDEEHALADALSLPTFEYANRRWYRRLTLLTRTGVIKWACYPVENPSRHPRQVLTWMQLNGSRYAS